MKKLLIALTLMTYSFNVFADGYGENQKPECHKIVQSQTGKTADVQSGSDADDKGATGK